jgi:hypothetical protein
MGEPLERKLIDTALGSLKRYPAIEAFMLRG